MIKKSVIFLAAGMAALLVTGMVTYGYWTDRLRLRCEVPVLYHVEISVHEDDEAMEAAMEAEMLDTELIMDLEAQEE